ncbi:MAG: YARHG domain-containing protein [Bacteroidetes bacterium]|nr:MAG: YARHG domain-containing protein [Bacteroidota bacterium]
MKRQLLTLSSLCTLLFLVAACSQPSGQSQTASGEMKAPEKGILPVSAKLSEKVVVAGEKDITGLWAGQFDSTANQKKLAGFMRELYGAEDFEFYEFISPETYSQIPADLRKSVEKDALYGEYYIAPPNKLSLVIDQFGEGKVTGRSVCAGNDRPLTGTYEATAEGWTMTLNEPGDDRYDGVFTVSFRKNDSLMTGTWKPFKPTVAEKTFTLYRSNFTYNPEYHFNWPSRFGNAEDLNASARVLTEADVENQPKATLRIARTAMYARHGYSFKNRDVRNFFEGFNDYVPVTGQDLRNLLTETELKNEALLKRYEAYAEEFYDQYGR